MYLKCGDSYRHAGNDEGIFLYDSYYLIKAAANFLHKKTKNIYNICYNICF